MKVFENVLSDEVLTQCSVERTSQFKNYVWSVSEFFWGAEIRVGVSGICVATLVSPELKNNIANCISRYLPEHDDLTIQHYVWMRGAAISRHDDYHVKFGATIYLNKDWNIDYGGIFLWKDQASHNIKNLLSPNFNTLVLNDEKEVHMVTPISMLAPELRLTLQIWGH